MGISISPSELASGEKQGAGFFEEIMRSVKDMIQEEYQRDRITGTDYANVYLGTMSAALQEASQFILQYKVTNQQLLLTHEQINQTKAATQLTLAQIANMEADTANRKKQLALMDQQIQQIATQTDQIRVQIRLNEQQIASMVKQDALVAAQTLGAQSQTALTDQNIVNAKNQNNIITKQIDKLGQEIKVLEQKLYTEQAQVLDTVKGQAVGGMIGKQKELYTAQKEGFKRDAEQKASKIYTDVWISLLSTLGSADPDQAGFSNSNTARIMDKLRAGIGIS